MRAGAVAGARCDSPPGLRLYAGVPHPPQPGFGLPARWGVRCQRCPGLVRAYLGNSYRLYPWPSPFVAVIPVSRAQYPGCSRRVWGPMVRVRTGVIVTCTWTCTCTCTSPCTCYVYVLYLGTTGKDTAWTVALRSFVCHVIWGSVCSIRTRQDSRAGAISRKKKNTTKTYLQ